ncbi:MAG: hypothetical protein LBU05_01235, partial [Bifidobacteriaceae bacterium]|nr:hypothetical protein [Bifidobacteriaceae bacterium]
MAAVFAVAIWAGIRVDEKSVAPAGRGGSPSPSVAPTEAVCVPSGGSGLQLFVCAAGSQPEGRQVAYYDSTWSKEPGWYDLRRGQPVDSRSAQLYGLRPAS